MSKQEILHAYRHLYRAALRTVRYAVPARYEARSVLRDAFRNDPPSAFSGRRIKNTLKFLETASTHNGYEHKILKNLLHLKYWRMRGLEKSLMRKQTDYALETRQHVLYQYDATLTMLNESMDMCLRI